MLVPALRAHARTVALFSSVCALALASACSDGERAGRGYNVVLVTLDTTRADFFSCYGYPRETTPNFDALSADGALFEQCSSAAAVTPVSHASILTGLYPYQHGLRVMMADGGYRISPDVPTLPELLQQRGYRTGAFLSSYPVNEVFGFDRGFDAFDWPAAPPGEQETENDGFRGWNGKQQRRSDVTTERALAWLGRTEVTEKAPFFLWMHLWDPHGGTDDPPEDLMREFVPEFLEPGFDRATVSNAQWRSFYAAQVKMIDRQFGRVVEELRRRGEYDNTIFVVVADHGEGLGDHGWGSHRILYQEQMRLPFLLRAPELPRGRRVGDLVRSIDIVPTVLELLDLPVPKVEGQSVVGLVEGRTESPRTAYAEQLNALDFNAKMVKKRPNDDFLHVFMDRDWKLIYRPTRPKASELFHLAVDPHEQRNLWGQGLAEGARLAGQLDLIKPYRTDPFPPSATGSAPDEDALRELGYFGADEAEGAAEAFGSESATSASPGGQEPDER